AAVRIAAVDEAAAGTRVTVRVTVDAEDAEGNQGGKPARVAEVVTLLASD
ncbi:MAG: hypothetical protein QOI51_251, partial [Nocardioidaceae bacterium]|nr:hypothetical protein [Nocardioidaceae bacterium]